jgi:hypothetical protein
VSEKPQQGRATMQTMTEQVHTELNNVMQRLIGTETAFNEFKVNVGSALSGINHQLNVLAQQLNNIQKTPWGTLFSGIGALSALIIFFVFQPLQAAITQQANTVESLKVAYVKGDEDIKSLLMINERFILEHTVTWREHEKLILDIENLRHGAVTQPEFTTHKEHHDKEIADLKSELRELQERLLYLERHPKG